MGTKWTQCRIGELVELQQGLCINKKSKHLLAENGYPLLLIKDLINNTESQYIDREKINKKFIAKKTDLIYTRTGQVGLVFKNKEGVVHNNSFTVTPNETINRDYLYWFLKTEYAFNYSRSVASGSSQPDLPHTAFKSMPFRYPPLPTQQKIAAILSNYDDLIENNNRRIKILEEMAKTLYQEWFVKFRFPNHENVKMVESELGLIPEGWEVKKLGDFGKVITGKTPSTKKPEYFGDYMPFIKTPSMHGNIFCIEVEQYLSDLGVMSQKNKTIPQNSIIVNCIGALAGSVSITYTDSQTNQQINAIVLKSIIYREFLYFTLVDLKETIRQYGSNGVTMINLNKSKFESLNILLPEQKILLEFNKKTNHIFELIRNLQIKNINLRKTRDLLLPKLISGEIDVENLNINTERLAA